MKCCILWEKEWLSGSFYIVNKYCLLEHSIFIVDIHAYIGSY